MFSEIQTIPDAAAEIKGSPDSEHIELVAKRVKGAE